MAPHMHIMVRFWRLNSQTYIHTHCAFVDLVSELQNLSTLVSTLQNSDWLNNEHLNIWENTNLFVSAQNISWTYGREDQTR